MTNFNDFGLPKFLTQSLERMGITTPTPIQAATIPPAMLGRDVLASANTGTGKTMAYLLPIIHLLLKSPNDSALIMLPTRELAAQVKDEANKLLGKSPSINFALLIGGDPIFKQLSVLKNQRPRLVIGTPGRIYDHLERGTLKLKDTKILVLDETDRMLDMGFCDAIDQIVAHLPAKRQTLMFSATMPPMIMKLSQKYLNNPDHTAIGSTTQASAQIKQEAIQTSMTDKFAKLLKELDDRKGSIIIFVKTKINAEKLADRLNDNHHSAEAIHGDLKQRKREQVIRAFRIQKNGLRIMVATDVASRGLDIPHVKHVINYDLPQCPEDYIHRIGRTGRAGMSGHALSLISPEDTRKWNVIHRLLTTEGSIDLPRFADKSGGGGGGNKPQKRVYKGDFRKSSGPPNGKQAPYRGKNQRRSDSDRGSAGSRGN